MSTEARINYELASIERDRLYIALPDKWTLKSICPLKLRNGNYMSDGGLGFLIASDGFSNGFTVHIDDMFMVSGGKNHQTEHFDTLDALLAKWTVD
jgi:hypothetical protein